MIRNRFVFTLMLIAISVGCDRTQLVSPNADSITESPFWLADKPSGAISLTEAVERLESDPQSKESPIGAESATPILNETAKLSSRPLVLVGKIDAGDFPAFEKDRATFMLSELPAEGHGGDDPDHEDNCPFCKRRAANAPKAIVNLVNDNGETIPTDARELLGVRQGDSIIVVGEATFDPTVKMLTIQSEGVYPLGNR